MAPVQHKWDKLAENLNELQYSYRETKELLDSQLQAVIHNDIDQLNELMEKQMDRYDEMQSLEKEFKNRLAVLCQNYCPEESHPSLSRLLSMIKGPKEEIEQLRVELYDQVHKTEQLRSRLTDLLVFASDYNSRSISELSGIARQTYLNYTGSGIIEEDGIQSLGLNKKV